MSLVSFLPLSKSRLTLRGTLHQRSLRGGPRYTLRTLVKQREEWHRRGKGHEGRKEREKRTIYLCKSCLKKRSILSERMWERRVCESRLGETILCLKKYKDSTVFWWSYSLWLCVCSDSPQYTQYTPYPARSRNQTAEGCYVELLYSYTSRLIQVIKSVYSTNGGEGLHSHICVLLNLLIQSLKLKRPHERRTLTV